jgi:hypothetical protein
MELRVLLNTHYLIREILVEMILDVQVRGVKIKKFLNSDVVTMYLYEKRFMKKYLCRFTHIEPYVPYETMVELMVGSIFSYS